MHGQADQYLRERQVFLGFDDARARPMRSSSEPGVEKLFGQKRLVDLVDSLAEEVAVIENRQCGKFDAGGRRVPGAAGDAIDQRVVDGADCRRHLKIWRIFPDISVLLSCRELHFGVVTRQE